MVGYFGLTPKPIKVSQRQPNNYYAIYNTTR